MPQNLHFEKRFLAQNGSQSSHVSTCCGLKMCFRLRISTDAQFIDVCRSVSPCGALRVSLFALATRLLVGVFCHAIVHSLRFAVALEPGRGRA
jgi:hypothetical protein